MSAATMLDRFLNADPLTRAIGDTVQTAVRDALAERLPCLTLAQVEAAEVLGVSPSTVSRMTKAGDLEGLPGVAGRVTLASVLRAAGWPMQPAPLSAPLAVVPEAHSA
jgi:hypothetical protein